MKDTLFFNKQIYSRKAVLGAIKDYSKLAKLFFSENKNYFVIKIKKINPEERILVKNEFCNYVLSLGKKL